MKKRFLTLLLFISFTIPLAQCQAQALKVVLSDTFIGTFNGALLGGGTMLLRNNSKDLGPMRFGVGFGTLYGLGIGFYDLSKIRSNTHYEVNGVLNSAGNSATLILTDTFYGGATGTLVGMAVSLMANSKVTEGLRYGAGIGVWSGFAFGVVDALVISKSKYQSKFGHYRLSDATPGIIKVQTGSNVGLSFLNPDVIQVKSIRNQVPVSQYKFAMNVVNVRLPL
ncbi:MAG TPA: hypothetical protein VKA08_08625 [Balneolales bacterium]|nr:hypothetical protein [Balneolales bacterium]